MKLAVEVEGVMEGVETVTGPRASGRRVHPYLGILLPLVASATLLVAVPLAAAADEDKRLKAEWVSRHHEVTLEYAQASTELEEAKREHRKARQRHRLQGKRRTDLTAALEAAQVRYSKAKKAMDDFPEEARRAGAAPGWFR